MRVMIAVPCMETVQTAFLASMLALKKPDGTEVALASCSLVYEARHTLAMKALNEGFDRVLWLDSDMNYAPDLLDRLNARLDEGNDFVCGLYFTRKQPVQPCVYKICRPVKNKRGEAIPTTLSFEEIPEGLFEAEACGFGAVMMTTDVIRLAGPLPFFPSEGFGEDLAFCRRARAAGIRIMCDPSVRADHVGTALINYDTWMQKKAGRDG